MSPEKDQKPISLEEVISNAKEILLRNGQHIPTLIVEGSKSLVAGQINDLPETHEERLQLMRFLGHAADSSGRIDQLQQVFLISEGWLSMASENKPLVMKPSQNPKRKEVLIISCIHMKEHKKNMKIFEILRDNNKDVTSLEEFLPDETKQGSVEVPLLDAFVDGFQMAFRARNN